MEYHLNTSQKRKMLWHNDLSRLNTNDLEIQEDDVLASLSESEFSNIKFPMYITLILKEQVKVQGLGYFHPEFVSLYLVGVLSTSSVNCIRHLTMGANSNVSSNKCVRTMASKVN
jgi:hypothetical protein